MSMIRILILSSLCLLSACSQAHLTSIVLPSPKKQAEIFPSGKYVLDDSHASITLAVSHLGLSNYTMQFTNFDAKLTFDAEKPENSKLVATVYMNSIETNYPNPSKKDFDKELAYKNIWFNANEYPTATFISNKIKLTGENTGIVYGDLTFLGITKPLELNVRFNGGFLKKPYVGVAALGFSADAILIRSNWGLDTYLPAIGDEVSIHMECEFHKE